MTLHVYWQSAIPIIVCLFLISCNETDSSHDFEEYDIFSRQAMLNYVDKDYATALANFQESFLKRDDVSENDYFNAASAALHLGRDQTAEELIKKAVTLCNAYEGYFQGFEGFDGFRQKELFTTIQQNYSELQNEYLQKQKCPSALDEVKTLIEEDQRVRNDGGSNSEMRQVDSLNIVRLIDITKECGWQDNCWVLLWHQRTSFREDNFVWSYFRPLIDSLIAVGEVRPDYWAGFEDQESIHLNGTQIYGYYTMNYDEYPIEDLNNVDKRRDSLGMAPLWYLDKVYGNIYLPKGYVVPTKLKQ